MENQPEKKKGGRPKRSAVTVSEPTGNGWDCSVCTFNNSAEAFKCSMCDTRKGTSTRKPRTNQQQALIHQASIQLTKKEKNMRKGRFKRPARLKNIDRNSAQHTVVTVGEVTVIITDYKPKPPPDPSALDDSLADDMSYYDRSSDTDLSDYP